MNTQGHYYRELQPEMVGAVDYLLNRSAWFDDFSDQEQAAHEELRRLLGYNRTVNIGYSPDRVNITRWVAVRHHRPDGIVVQATLGREPGAPCILIQGAVASAGTLGTMRR